MSDKSNRRIPEPGEQYEYEGATVKVVSRRRKRYLIDVTVTGDAGTQTIINADWWAKAVFVGAAE